MPSSSGSDGVGLFPADADQDGLFEPFGQVDWTLYDGMETSVLMSWGEVPCILRGPGKGGEPPGLMVELLNEKGEHKHKGHCTLVQVASILVRVPPATARRRSAP